MNEGGITMRRRRPFLDGGVFVILKGDIRKMEIRKIKETDVQADEFALRANRIEIPASITACGFYRKMGYDYKNGVNQVDEEGLFRLEKFRKR